MFLKLEVLQWKNSYLTDTYGNLRICFITMQWMNVLISSFQVTVDIFLAMKWLNRASQKSSQKSHFMREWLCGQKTCQWINYFIKLWSAPLTFSRIFSFSLTTKWICIFKIQNEILNPILSAPEASHCRVRVSCYHISNEKIYDLLVSPCWKIRMKAHINE